MAAGRPDDFQTPAEALDPLVPYLDASWRIWEPAKGKGSLVRSLQSKGFDVVGSDWEEGFLNWRPDCFDVVVSNPPYSKKLAFLSRCYDLGKPFALLMPITVFDSQDRRSLFQKHGVQIIFPRGRINYETPNHEARIKVGKKSSAWFLSVWVCWKLDLPSQLVFTGCDAEPSLMSVA
jgi:hypothetical protein